MAKQKKALGRGLSAILSNPNTDITQSKKSTNNPTPLGTIGEIEISTIEINPFQPRSQFDQSELEALALSIKELGVIQPITVRKLGYDKYQLISGERRFRASQIAGLTKIPAYTRIANDQEMLEMALVENIQRQDLNAIEVALSYQLLIDECDLTQDQMSKRIGKKRSTVSNYLRLLKLSPLIQAGIQERFIGMGHAKALLNIEDEATQIKLYKQIIEDSLSVRQVEELTRISKGKSTSKNASKTNTEELLPFHIQQLIKQLNSSLNKKSEIKLSKKGNGKITIPFKDEYELEQILKCFD